MVRKINFELGGVAKLKQVIYELLSIDKFCDVLATRKNCLQYLLVT